MTKSTQLEALAKFIVDVDVLVNALLKSTAATQRWQRQLIAHLERADTCMQILRMTIAMDKPNAEAAEAATQLVASLSEANDCLRGGRAGAETKAALRLAGNLASKVAQSLERADRD